MENKFNNNNNSAITRKCTKDYPVPGTDYVIPKGLRISLPPLADCFKNQDNFDPDNFAPENNPNKFGFTGFGQGPRNCLGGGKRKEISIFLLKYF